VLGCQYFADVLEGNEGMLGSVATIEMLAQALADHKVERAVLDPVST